MNSIWSLHGVLRQVARGAGPTHVEFRPCVLEHYKVCRKDFHAYDPRQPNVKEHAHDAQSQRSAIGRTFAERRGGLVAKKHGPLAIRKHIAQGVFHDPFG